MGGVNYNGNVVDIQYGGSRFWDSLGLFGILWDR